jgi:hypothetical protein
VEQKQGWRAGWTETQTSASRLNGRKTVGKGNVFVKEVAEFGRQQGLQGVDWAEKSFLG